MNIIIPIAGNTEEGTSIYAKILHEIGNKTILQFVLESVATVENYHLMIVLKEEDAKKNHLNNIVKLLEPDAEIILASGITRGAACTCMLTIDTLKLEEPLLILGSDQIITTPLNQIVEHFQKEDVDAGVVIFDDIHPRWSYVKLNENKEVTEAAEKRPISRNATAGVYYFKKASYFMDATKKMILKGSDVHGEYYISPCLNEMILNQQVVGTYPIEKKSYFSFGHASGIEAFEKYLGL